MAATKADPKKVHVAHQWKHGSPLIACCFSPDGKYVFTSGEDYALLVAAPVEATLPASFRRVGSCEAANTTESNQQDQQPRVWLKDGAECRPLAPRGFDHFARPLGE